MRVITDERILAADPAERGESDSGTGGRLEWEGVWENCLNCPI